MSVYHCIFCLRPATTTPLQTDAYSTTGRAVKLLERHLKLKPNSNPDYYYDYNVCQSCASTLEAFSGLYEEIKGLELRLEAEVAKLRVEVEHANRVPARGAFVKLCYLINLEENNKPCPGRKKKEPGRSRRRRHHGMDEMYFWRRSFSARCRKKLASDFPRVLLQKLPPLQADIIPPPHSQDGGGASDPEISRDGRGRMVDEQFIQDSEIRPIDNIKTEVVVVVVPPPMPCSEGADGVAITGGGGEVVDPPPPPHPLDEEYILPDDTAAAAEKLPKSKRCRKQKLLKASSSSSSSMADSLKRRRTWWPVAKMNKHHEGQTKYWIRLPDAVVEDSDDGPKLKSYRRYQCSYPNCAVVSHTSSAVIKHYLRGHTIGLERYKCAKCDAAYHDPHDLKKHIMKHHEGNADLRFSCRSCGLRFRTVRGRAAHVKACHNNE